jgi:hypothetical protein
MSETELFDEDAHELQAMITNNSFDLEIMSGDANTMKNFGTVDNPVIIQSANVGWRYVYCTGLNDEDEGSSHSGVWFILREGPIHRCHACGQCYKLVNLKDEISAENDYYMEHYMHIKEEEMGDTLEPIQRWSFHNFSEPYSSLSPMMNISFNYIIVNADDHDRILTDPAYRLQKLADGHRALGNLQAAMVMQEQAFLMENGGFFPKVEYSPQMYNDLVLADNAIRRLDRVFKRVHRYNIRAQLNPENHERRQTRMLERVTKRSQSFTVYLETSEKETRYRDYFETDYDPEDDAMGDVDDWLEQRAFGNYHFENYEFIEEGLSLPTPAVMGTFYKKLFNFKHRAFNSDALTHILREKRMVSRFLERTKTRDQSMLMGSREIVDKVSTEEHMWIVQKVQPYRDYMTEEAIKQYKDYYESDQEDLEDFDHISSDEKAKFSEAFTDFTRPTQRNKFVLSFEAPKYDPSKGPLGNIASSYRTLRSKILPNVRDASTEVAASHLIPLTSDEIDFDMLEGSIAKEDALSQSLESKGHRAKQIKLIEDIDELWSKAVDEFGEAYNPPNKPSH